MEIRRERWRRAPAVEHILDGDEGVIGQLPEVHDTVASLPDHILLGEPAGGLLQLPQRIPTPPT